MRLPSNPSLRTWHIAATVAGAALISGCSQDASRGGGFISDDPTNLTPGASGDGSLDEGSSDSSTSSGTGGSSEGAGGSNAAPPDDPERAILEADIVQVDDGVLYALSEFSGLTIIDISDPAHMAILGRKKLGGQPFEMYRVGTTVYAMFRNWGEYQELDGAWTWITTSHVEALDVADPAAIETIGSLEVPGTIADSRMVGDVLYTVSFEDGYCYDCATQPGTTVSSFDAGDPASITKLDELRLVEDQYGGWGRSISVTQDRIYVGGVDWSSEGTSTIEIVDISDPDGALVRGASVPVDGQILNRWQMDEENGVLRVISQPWSTSVYPSIQTFTVTSSALVTPLGKAEITLPQPESLRSVRFDGDRAYAITAEQVDPLFTIDLSDPASPQVRGQLVIPGWVYHIEPRGNQLLALGYDPSNTEGSMNVSLFDVSDLDAPTLVKRVAFGADWGSFAEDQDRIHKAFTILPDLGLLLVPFSAWNWDDYGCSTYESGVQLVDWSQGTLTKRGVAPVRGFARRAFMSDGQLFAMSDEQVRTFDLADRDAPQKSGELQLANHVSQIQVGGDLTVRLAADWWTSEPRLEVVPSNDPARDQPLGAIDLGAMLAEVENDSSCYSWSWWAVRLFTHGNTVYLVWPSYDGNTARVATVDVSDPTHPTLLAHADVLMDGANYGGGYYYYGGTLVSAGDTVAQVGDRLVFQQIDYAYDAGYYDYESGADLERGGRISVLDLAVPATPRLVSVAQLPVGLGHTGLVADGDRVLFSHWEPTDVDGKVRFYLDRYDVASAKPVVEPKINVPGSLVSYDAASRHLLTVDYVRRIARVNGYEACYTLFGWGAMFQPDDTQNWDYSGPGSCTRFDRSLKVAEVDEVNGVASLLDEQSLATRDWVSNLVVGDDRVFFTGADYSDDGTATTDIWAVGGIRAGELEIARTRVDDTWWAYPVATDGQTLVAMSSNALVTVDSSDLSDLAVAKVEDLPWWVQDVTVADGRALLSLGPYGVKVVELP